MNKSNVKEDLYQYISNLPIVNTHTHIFSDKQLENIDLDLIISNSYLTWMVNPPGKSIESRREYILANKCNSYYRWLNESLRDLYGLELTADNYGELDERIKTAYKGSKFHLDILQKCGYEKSILDKFDNPGHDNNHPDVFSPAFRINSFMMGYDRTARDYRGISAYDFIDSSSVSTFDEYLEAMCAVIRTRKKQGAVAIKNPSAYDRSLIYDNTDKLKASRAFDNPNASIEDKKNFSDYIMFTITDLAEELGMPIQIHTGMGCIDNTRAINLRKLIQTHPNTKFDILHASYPWTSDAFALLHYFNNTYIDICWLPILSSFEAKEFIKKALEVGNAHRICWGCDVRTSEDSYGALMAMRHVLSDALTDMVVDGAMDMEYAQYVAKRILYDNAKDLFKV